MNPVRRGIAGVVVRHSLFWFVAANLVGVWLAAVLLWPALGDLVAPLSYGRWVPLHLNWQLYGWCSLPLVAALLDWCFDEDHPGAVFHARLALGAWSLALALGGLSWLAGHTSGKLFLDWHGWTRGLLPAAMIVLWTFLAAHTWWRRARLDGRQLGLRASLLAMLFFVPPVMYLSSAREIYPAVNPDSGGATGAALLGSTLGIVSVFGFLPVMLRRHRAAAAGWFWVALVASWGMFAGMSHGSVSHHLPGQIIGLGLLLAWIPLLIVYWSKFDWPAGARTWLGAAFVWWLLLVVTGWLSFLPDWSERLKFTNGLVAHAHLAMAGLVTAVSALILQVLSGALRHRGAFWLWQTGCVLHVILLLGLGWIEADRFADLVSSETWMQWIYGGRLIAGLAMASASVLWLKEAVR